MPIQIDRGVAVNAIELNADALAFPIGGAVNVLRYQPVPAGKNPPSEPVGLSLSGAPRCSNRGEG